jgi:hypothetical protein
MKMSKIELQFNWLEQKTFLELVIFGDQDNLKGRLRDLQCQQAAAKAVAAKAAAPVPAVVAAAVVGLATQPAVWLLQPSEQLWA